MKVKLFEEISVVKKFTEIVVLNLSLLFFLIKFNCCEEGVTHVSFSLFITIALDLKAPLLKIQNDFNEFIMKFFPIISNSVAPASKPQLF